MIIQLYGCLLRVSIAQSRNALLQLELTTKYVERITRFQSPNREMPFCNPQWQFRMIGRTIRTFARGSHANEYSIHFCPYQQLFQPFLCSKSDARGSAQQLHSSTSRSKKLPLAPAETYLLDNAYHRFKCHDIVYQRRGRKSGISCIIMPLLTIFVGSPNELLGPFCLPPFQGSIRKSFQARASESQSL